jgi:two-component system NtrC family sensor kinase
VGGIIPQTLLMDPIYPIISTYTMKKLRDWSLRQKIILHVTVIGLLTALILTFLLLNSEKKLIRTLGLNNARMITSLVQNSMTCYMKSSAEKRIEDNLNQISSSVHIRYIRVLDTSGTILHSSDPAERGGRIDEFTMEHLNTLLVSREELAAFLRSDVLAQGLKIVLNQRECRTCHNPGNGIIGILDVSMDHQFSKSVLHRDRMKAVLVGFFALFVLTFVIIRLFEKLINRPISQLKKKMKKVEEGDLDVAIVPRKNDEIGSLSKSFSDMVEKLKQANIRIEELFQQKMERAEHLASLGELAAGLAHEIKNPVAGMRGALEIISQKVDASDPQKEIFSELIIQLEKINKIIDDLLSYAKPKKMSITRVDPNVCIENAIKLAEPQTAGREIGLHFQRYEGPDLADMDADKIQEVVLNLVLNAIAAIKEKGIVRVTLGKEGERDLEITIADSGSGIKPDQLDQIFKPFFTTKKRGTGLGLSICRRIVEAHGGRIDVLSRLEEGTEFHISMPVFNAEAGS